jgi:copper resistance protein D
MPLISLLRGVHIAATVVIGGAIAFDLLVLGRGERTVGDAVAADSIRGWLRRLAAAGVIVGVLSWAAWLAVLAISMSGQPPAQAWTPGVLRTLISRTTFGHVWAIRLVLLLVLPACLPPRPAAREARWTLRDAMAAAGGIGLAGSLAATGHALGTHAAHLWADAAHLVGAALWVGMLPPLALVLGRAAAAAPPGGLEFAAAAVRRFSAPAMVAVIVLTASGVANAWWLLDSPGELVSTRYGLLLLAKIALFGLMLVLAAVNRIWWTPRLEARAGAGDRLLASRRLLRNVMAELLLGTAVLFLVGVLGVTAPPSHEHTMHHGQESAQS